MSLPSCKTRLVEALELFDQYLLHDYNDAVLAQMMKIHLHANEIFSRGDSDYRRALMACFVSSAFAENMRCLHNLALV